MKKIILLLLLFVVACSCPDADRIKAIEKQNAQIDADIHKLTDSLDSIDDQNEDAILWLEIQKLINEDDIEQIKKNSTCL